MHFMGPILFIYYINDIPHQQNTKLALFADDTAIFCSSWSKNTAVKNAKSHLDIIQKYFNIWKIKTNATKTELVVFSRKIKEKVEPIKIDGVKIEAADSAKYLGVLLDKKLSFTEHINKAVRKAYMPLSCLYNLLSRKSTLSTKNKLTLYKMVIKPVMLYAAPIWSNTTVTNVNKLETIQNKILRLIARVEPNTTNLEIRESLKMNILWEDIHSRTKDCYTIQIQHLEILIVSDVSIYNHENAPLKSYINYLIKYLFPQKVCDI